MIVTAVIQCFNYRTHSFDVNEALIKASVIGHHNDVRHFITIPGIDINSKDSNNNRV